MIISLKPHLNTLEWIFRRNKGNYIKSWIIIQVKIFNIAKWRPIWSLFCLLYAKMLFSNRIGRPVWASVSSSYTKTKILFNARRHIAIWTYILQYTVGATPCGRPLPCNCPFILNSFSASVYRRGGCVSARCVFHTQKCCSICRRGGYYPPAKMMCIIMWVFVLHDIFQQNLVLNLLPKAHIPPAKPRRQCNKICWIHH